MSNRNEKEGFSYTYSAKEQEEVKRIRKKYQPKEDDKMERIRKMDAMVEKKATSCAIAVGVIGVLIMGSGMSLIMTNLGESIGLAGSMLMVIGIMVGLLGCVLVGVAYPLYSYIVKKERKKIAPEIIKLTDELLK